MMLIELFDVENGVLIPTKHCYSIRYLKDLMTYYPDNYIKIYQFLYYMYYPDPKKNPFFNLKESDKEEVIYSHIDGDFSLEDPIIRDALERTLQLSETAGKRAYIGLKVALDNLSTYLKETPISHGRDGNINSIITTAKNFTAIKEAFNKAYEEMQKENMQIRGNRDLGYDQRGHGMKEDDIFEEGGDDEPVPA